MSDTDPLEAEYIYTDSDAEAETEIAIRGSMLPHTIHVLPVFERPFFPAQAVPVIMDEERWLPTIEAIGETKHHMVGLVMARQNDLEILSAETIHHVGSIARIHQPSRMGGKIQFIAEGLQRFRIVQWITKEPPYLVQVAYPNREAADDDNNVRAYALAIINSIKDLLPLNPLYSEGLKYFLNRFSPNEPSPLTDFAAGLTSADSAALQDVLETFPLIERMQKVLVLLQKEMELAKVQHKIRQQVEEQISEQQRRFFLREQLKELQKELGLEKDDRTADLERFWQRLEKLTLPEHAQKRLDDEIQKFSILEVGSPEYGVTRNYLDWITALPWGVDSEDILDLKRARRILDRDHDGLDDVKQRILEFLAVGQLRGTIAGSILLLVGPPGVGKTSIGRSIAETVGRKFYRFSVGGMRDEAEIKGHRRTYVGAIPGKFLHSLKEAGTENPLIMLDEIDKLGASYQGDPAAALLEVLDPEQNSEFLDHYLDLRFDLSKVLFVCTANQIDTIPGPLLDRMEVIRLSGYITAEKAVIAKHHLWPRQLAKAGLKGSQLKISDSALLRIIENYAREAGVRNLEKQLGKVVRKAAMKLVSGEKGTIRIGQRTLENYLGKPFFGKEKPLVGVGVAVGLAWTPLGGATLSIEASLVHDLSRGFKLTGKLGDTMRESAEIAYSYISSHLKQFAADPARFDNVFIHLHVPEGATPKDGPSAGITMATALLSLARKQRPENSIAMSGELTLTGSVYPVGGIREKVIAARRIGISELILSEANRGDFEELPKHIRHGLTSHFVKHYREVVPIIFPA